MLQEMKTIKDCRLQLGLSQRQMAERLGISVSYYSLIENGLRNITAQVVERLNMLGYNINAEYNISTNSIVQRIQVIKDDFKLMSKLDACVDDLVKEYKRSHV